MLQAEQSRIESVAYVQRIKRLCLYLSVVFDMMQSNSSEWLLCISSEQHVSYSYLWPKDTTTAKSKDPQQARKCRHIRRCPTEMNAHNNQESRWKGHCTFLCHTFKQKEGRRRALFVSASTAACRAAKQLLLLYDIQYVGSSYLASYRIVLDAVKVSK